MDIEIFISGIMLILGICILVIIHAWVSNRNSNSTGEDEEDEEANLNNHNSINSSRRPSMAIDDIDKLPTFEYKMELDKTNGLIMDCAVCLENFKLLDLCRLLPDCKHSFHVLCIDLWLAKTAACPICRTDVRLGKTGGEGSGAGAGGDLTEVGDGLV
ncbi:RING-H2 finger protein ATL39-like [Impatiens glandulifera]|uniref:RING-H2 finger protein ATL39-like n=1 Tax=Impatiens glandulifera TaxID=253017 RepID=UPI001FB181C6|nr:RING-H2 finger protein ATL39-like [Impatiens glandulifera]